MSTSLKSNRKRALVSILSALACLTMVACGGSALPAASTVSAAAPAAAVQAAAQTTTEAAGAVPTSVVAERPTSAAQALAENAQVHTAATSELEMAGSGASIELQGDSATVSGEGASATGSTVVITAGGTYRITGTLADGQIVVETGDEGQVTLILDGAEIQNSAGPAIYIADADVAVIELAAGSENLLTDGEEYELLDPDTGEPNAALFSTADLTIAGDGSLTIDANFNDGIASKDGMVIEGGTIAVDAADDGIRGKDYLIIEDGAITVTAEGDGLKSDNEEDATKGYIAIRAGQVTVEAGGDAIQAATDVTIAGDTLDLTAGGGDGAGVAGTDSAKGIKAGVNIVIESGAFQIDAADDAINSNDTMTVNGGQFEIETGDDGMHADAQLTINDGQSDISRSYEGVESAVITINGGELDIVSSDDGLNVAGGNDGSGMGQPMPGGRTGRAGGPRQDVFAASTGQYLYINGGRIAIDSGGDGIDINGAVEMTDGVLIVQGPTENMNGALDYDAGFKITGGYVIAAGSAGMAQAPDSSSSQLSLLISFSSLGTAGALLHLESAGGADILTFSPEKVYQSIAFSSPELEEGETYLLYGGGSASGTPENGLYKPGSYSPGSEVASVTLSGVVTELGGRYR